nr:hypothetical protein [Mesorhizobium sp.]
MSEKEVLSVIRGQEDATAKGDARANVDAMDPDVVVFDLPPPLAYRGEQARDIEGINAWFATWRNGVTVHMADPQLMIDGDLAVAFGLSRMTGIKTDGRLLEPANHRAKAHRRFLENHPRTCQLPYGNGRKWPRCDGSLAVVPERLTSSTGMSAFTRQGFVGERRFGGALLTVSLAAVGGVAA